MVRITNLYKWKGGKEVPNYYFNNDCKFSVFLYVVKNIQKCLKARDSIRIFNFVRNLKADSGVVFKNLGNPDYRKVWGFGKIVIFKPQKGLEKGLSSIATSQPLLSGEEIVKVKLKELDMQVNNFIKTGEKVKKLSELLRMSEFLEGCYYKIKSKKEVLIPGLDKIILDGISKTWFKEVSKNIIKGNIHFIPVRRKLIRKRKGGERPLGIPSPKDKIIHEALRQLLEMVFEKIFVMNSHGFRLNRSCHTALNHLRMRMGSVCWFIEGNISKCYESINHNILISKLEKVISDQPFIDIIYKVLRSGYGENINNVYHSKIGLPQGGVISPILANIYLHEFDLTILNLIHRFDKGKERKANPSYTKMIWNSKVDRKRNIRPLLGRDKSFKRMEYIRYADDFLIGIIGSKEDCVQVKKKISKILWNEFKLTLNLNKTKISHASKDGAYFLGHNIYISDMSKHKVTYVKRGNQNVLTRLVSRPILNAPINKIIEKLALIGYCKKSGNPMRCSRLIHESLYEIINKYLILQRGLLNYYSQSSNYGRFAARIYYILKYSCALTFASKLKLKTLKKVFKKFGENLTVIIDKNKKYQSYPKISYKKPRKKVSTKIFDPMKYIVESVKFVKRSNLLLNKVCSLCSSSNQIEIHHIKHLRKEKSKDWLTRRMQNINRKQIPVCRMCHIKIHTGKYDGSKLSK